MANCCLRATRTLSMFLFLTDLSLAYTGLITRYERHVALASTLLIATRDQYTDPAL